MTNSEREISNEHSNLLMRVFKLNVIRVRSTSSFRVYKIIIINYCSSWLFCFPLFWQQPLIQISLVVFSFNIIFCLIDARIWFGCVCDGASDVRRLTGAWYASTFAVATERVIRILGVHFVTFVRFRGAAILMHIVIGSVCLGRRRTRWSGSTFSRFSIGHV